LLVRTFRSGQPLGRGVTLQTRWAQDQGGLGYLLYRSPYQPYTVYVPQHPTGATLFLLHFLGGNYMSYPITSMPALSEWAEQLGITVIMPLARGEAGWYESEAEKDFFEVWRDFAAHHGYDPNRVYLSGMSMGGHGTWRLGQLYPDLFAAAIIWSGTVAPNTIWLGAAPVMYPQQNPPACQRDTWINAYGATGGGTYRYVFYPDRKHETSYPATTKHFVLDWLKGLPVRQENPARVTYILQQRHMQPDVGGFKYTGAYWVNSLKLAAGASQGTVDADRSVTPARATVLAEQLGTDSLGPYRLRGTDVSVPASLPNQVSLTLSSLARAGLDTTRMGWDLAAEQHIKGKTDTAVDLVVRGGYAPMVSVRGATFSRDGGAIVLRLPAGAFDVAIAGATTGPLPNTGASNPWLVLAALATLAALSAAGGLRPRIR
jgi:LPXTG-motif cell wall-anchored protein